MRCALYSARPSRSRCDADGGGQVSGTHGWQSGFDSARQGSKRDLARFITRVENRDPGWQGAMQLVYPYSGNALVIGVTGSPGVGKSSLCNRITSSLTSQQKRVGIIAIDPSSPFSGGALLGDRVRMRDVFIRSMATRGSLGGLCQAARDVVHVLDATGYDVILIETVGVGQGEIEVVRTADLVAVICVPGQGDGVQAIKAGIMEIADLYVVNKADVEGAEGVIEDIKAMQALGGLTGEAAVPVVPTSAASGEGIDQLVAELATLGAHKHGISSRRQAQIRQELLGLIQQELVFHVEAKMLESVDFAAAVDAVVNRQTDPYSAARTLLDRFSLS